MVTGALLLAGLLLAQGTDANDLVPLNQRNLQIPIRIQPARRAEIKELLLFSSSDQGKTWQQIAVAAPDKDAFTFYAPADGVYWFSVCVVDVKGNRDPADIYKTTPGQKVLIDTLKPAVRIVSAERQGEDVVVAWDIQEDHPDLATFKLEYQTAEAPSWMWTQEKVAAALAGQARIRSAGLTPLRVRVQMADTAANSNSTQAEVKPAAASSSQFANATPSPSAPTPAPVSQPPPPAPPSVTSGPSMPALPTPGLPPVPAEGPRMAAAPGTHSTYSESNFQPASLTPDPRAWPSVAAAANPTAAAPLTNDAGSRLVASSATSKTMAPPIMGTNPASGPRTTPGLQLTNTTRVTLEYKVDKVGPSGIGKVELYITRDEGRNWEKLADDPHLKSPITADLPGEGIYGLTLVVQSRAGMSRRPPQPGDLPQMRLEVDTTLPTAKLFAPELAPNRRDALVLTWEATDRNLTASPITIEWAERPDAAWQNIAADYANTGSFTWKLPENLPMRVFLRLSVRDKAGNLSVAETPQAILVDLVEPEGQLIGVLGANRPSP